MKLMQSVLLSGALVLTLGMTPAVMAHSLPHTPGQPSLVALGDSITMGYNLGKTNRHPSRRAFPYLIAQAESMRVRDLGVPGATSTALLQALGTEKYEQAVRHASVLTLDIGSDDLLGLALKDGLLNPQNPNPVLTPTEAMQFAQALQTYQNTLPKIVMRIRALNPRAPILLYNIYNPIPTQYPGLYALASMLIGNMNAIIASEVPMFPNTLPVNDYSAFLGHTATFILPNDVHPSVAGQQALAVVGEEALVGIDVSSRHHGR